MYISTFKWRNKHWSTNTYFETLSALKNDLQVPRARKKQPGMAKTPPQLPLMSHPQNLHPAHPLGLPPGHPPGLLLALNLLAVQKSQVKARNPPGKQRSKNPLNQPNPQSLQKAPNLPSLQNLHTWEKISGIFFYLFDIFCQVLTAYFNVWTKQNLFLLFTESCSKMISWRRGPKQLNRRRWRGGNVWNSRGKTFLHLPQLSRTLSLVTLNL